MSIHPSFRLQNLPIPFKGCMVAGAYPATVGLRQGLSCTRYQSTAGMAGTIECNY